jgi:hypothetical protein
MAQPEYLLAQLQTLSARSDLISILDAWGAYLDAHGVPPLGGSLVDRLAYHAALRGITVQSLWNGNLQAPSQILISSSPGFAFDVSNISSLWQDTAGTIPVTEPGDPVARMDDVSSRGNHALQADTNKQPTYQVDSNGNGYLAFDGLDDFLVTPAIDLSGSPLIYALAAVVREGTPQADIILEQTASSAGTPGAFAVNVASGQARAILGMAAGTSSQAIHVTPELKMLWGVSYNTAAGTSEGAIPALRFGRADVTATAAYVGAPTPTAAGANGEVYVASRAGTGLFLQGRLYGAVVRGGGTQLSTVRALEDYYAARF